MYREVPPVATTVIVLGTPTSVWLGEAVNVPIVRMGFTVSDRFMLAYPPEESFKKARTVNVPEAVGVHENEALADDEHPGRPEYE